MIGPNAQLSKLLLIFLFLITIFFLWMDVNLYIRIQNYPIRDNEIRLLNGSSVQKPTVPVTSSAPYRPPTQTSSRYEDVTWVSCELNPLCDVTVKAMMLDHTNHYLFSTMATITDNVVGFSRGNLITPNMISFFHVLVAIASGRMIASDSLGHRRIGVVLFLFRTFLDDLDGHVARAKKHIHGEQSDVGSSGYYVDAICDSLGSTAVMIGVFFFLKNNPPRRGYSQLQSFLPVSDSKNSESGGSNYKAKVPMEKIALKVMCYCGILLLTAGWNRYIAIYQDMLQREDVTPTQFLHQESVFRSSGFFLICWLWRIVNFHALLHFLLLSIFFDKLWEYLNVMQYVGFIALLVTNIMAEVHRIVVQHFIFKSLNGNNTRAKSNIKTTSNSDVAGFLVIITQGAVVLAVLTVSIAKLRAKLSSGEIKLKTDSAISKSKLKTQFDVFLSRLQSNKHKTTTTYSVVDFL